MRSPNVWQARAQRRYLLSMWPWRSGGYLLSGVPVGALCLLVMLAGVAVGGVLTVVLVGVPVLIASALAGVPAAALERRRLRLVDPRPALSPHRVPAEVGLLAWARTRFSPDLSPVQPAHRAA